MLNLSVNNISILEDLELMNVIIKFYSLSVAQGNSSTAAVTLKMFEELNLLAVNFVNEAREQARKGQREEHKELYVV